jgi:hypothetical protein
MEDYKSSLKFDREALANRIYSEQSLQYANGAFSVGCDYAKIGDTDNAISINKKVTRIERDLL